MTKPATIQSRVRADGDALAQALRIERADAQREAQIFLCKALGWERARVLAHPEYVPSADEADRYDEMIARRVAQEPVAYILGEREFYGLRFIVSPAVLIPRPETELIVELALERIPPSTPARILDLGSGSGCIAVTLAKLRPQASVIAVDISRAALELVRRNAEQNSVTNVEFAHGSWYLPIDGQRFDVIVSNPPYVAAGDPHLAEGDLRFEPPTALVSGADGRDALREIVGAAPAHLVAGGALLVEHGFDQADAVRALMDAAGLIELSAHIDLAGIRRVASGRLP